MSQDNDKREFLAAFENVAATVIRPCVQVFKNSLAEQGRRAEITELGPPTRFQDVDPDAAITVKVFLAQNKSVDISFFASWRFNTGRVFLHRRVSEPGIQEMGFQKDWILDDYDVAEITSDLVKNKIQTILDDLPSE